MTKLASRAQTSYRRSRQFISSFSSTCPIWLLAPTTLVAGTPLNLHGYLDFVDHTLVCGWARNDDAWDHPVSLIITDNGEIVARVLANAFRVDLLGAGVGNQGRLSFSLPMSLSPLKRHVIEVIGEVDGAHLRGSPVVLEVPIRFDDGVKAAIANVMATAGTEAEVAERLAFLAAQSELLLRLNDRRQARENERAARQGLRWRLTVNTPPMVSTAVGPSALVIDSRMPVTTRDAGSLAIVSHMRALQRLGYTVTFLPSDLSGETMFLEGLGIVSLLRPWYASVEEALARHGSTHDVVYVHRVENAPYLPLVRLHQPRARLVFSVADLASVRIWRQAEIEQRPELEAQSHHHAAAEIAALHHPDAVITHSTFEASILKQSVDAKKIYVVPFTVPDRATVVPVAARSGLAFIGGFDHRPNVDAARWLVEAIMPKVFETHPAITCLLVGSAMPDHISRLASETIVPIGAVDDLAVIFDRVRLTIAPLAFGAGVKGKVLASLAAGIPCVCTPIAAEGLDLPPLLQRLTASEPEVLAALIVRLHEDEDYNRQCSRAGIDFIAGYSSEAAVDAAMARVLDPAYCQAYQNTESPVENGSMKDTP